MFTDKTAIMALQNQQPSPKLSSSESDPSNEMATFDHSSPDRTPKEDDVDNLNYPEPWKWEKFFPGGYTQGRMVKFKTPKTMYTAINLFAGVAIMFYGYDQVRVDGPNSERFEQDI